MSKKAAQYGPRKPRRSADHEALPGIPNSVLDDLIKKSGGSVGVTGPNGLLKQLTSALVNRLLETEMSEHLGYERGESPSDAHVNRRNGHREKSVRTEHGEVDIEVPRDRVGSFEPLIVPKHERSFRGFDKQILSMYSRGMSNRDISSHLEELYGVNVSADFISTVTDAVLDEVHIWQNRPLDRMYPIVYMDALVIKIRDKGVVVNKSMYMVVGIDEDGEKNVLGAWLQNHEGAKFWLSILNDLRVRGVEDILILCADGLMGMAEAVEASFPKTIFQTCVVHMIRSSTRFVSYKDLKAICADMKPMYTAVNVEAAQRALEAFEAKWGKTYPHAVKSWRTRFEEWTPFLGFAPEIRRAVYTTNVIEGLNRILRKTLKTRGALPTDDAAFKLVFMAIQNTTDSWGKRHREWSTAKAQFAIHFASRFTES